MKEITLLLSRKEIATLIAALRYWQDEMAPHGPESARPYFEGLDADPLTANEFQMLLDRLLEAVSSESEG